MIIEFLRIFAIVCVAIVLFPFVIGIITGIIAAFCMKKINNLG